MLTPQEKAIHDKLIVIQSQLNAAIGMFMQMDLNVLETKPALNAVGPIPQPTTPQSPIGPSIAALSSIPEEHRANIATPDSGSSVEVVPPGQPGDDENAANTSGEGNGNI